MKSFRRARAPERSSPREARIAGAAAVLAWTLFFAALAAVPDARPLRLKLLALHACVLLAGLSCAWSAARSARSFARTPLDLPVALWACAAALFWISSPEPASSAAELARALSCAVAFFAASQTFARLEKPDRQLYAWAGSGAAAAVWAWYQWRFAGAERPHGTFGNPIFLGQYLAACAAATFGLAVLAQRRWERVALNTALAAQLVGLWLAQSRAAFLGLAAALGLWLVLRAPGKRRIPLAAVLLALCGFLAWHFRERAATHLLIWQGALSLWREHPMLGCGMGRFHLDFPRHAPIALQALWPKTRVIVNYAHNEYLQLLAETGLVGLAVFLAAPLTLARRLAAEPESRRAAAADVPALAAAALLAGAAASPDLRFGVSSLACFAALGMASGLRFSQWSAWESVPSWTRAPALAAAVGVLAVWGRLAAQPLLSERALQAQPGFHEEPGLRQASAPDGDHEALGYLYAKRGQWARAIESFERVVRLDPAKPGPLNNLGNAYYSMGDQAAAERYWNRSLEAAPGQADAHLNLAKLLHERGDLRDAARHAQAALKADPGNPRALALLKRLTGG